MHGPTKELLDDELKVMQTGEVWHYFVHFLKWNSRFDMWVVEENVYPDNEQSRELSTCLLCSIRGIKSASKLAEAIEIAEDDFWAGKELHHEEEIQPKPKREPLKNEKERKEEARLEELRERSLCDPLPPELEQLLPLTLSLKKIMVDEYEAITQLNLFPDLPATVTVETVLHQYLDLRLSVATDESEREEWKVSIDHLSSYFDKAIPYLLFPQETLFTSPDPPRSIYSCQYLLRLFTKLPTVMKEDQKAFIFKINDLVRYLTKNQYDIFEQSYYTKANQIVDGKDTRRVGMKRKIAK